MGATPVNIQNTQTTDKLQENLLQYKLCIPSTRALNENLLVKNVKAVKREVEVTWLVVTEVWQI